MVVVALIVMCGASVGLSARATYGAHTSGDEPYYLLTATSLVEDHDLDISDELRSQSHTPYHEIPLDPQTAPVGGDARISPHDPLLPVLLAPVMTYGWLAAKLWLAMLTAVTAALTTRLAIRRFDLPPVLTVAVVSGLFLGMPLAPYATQVYPEMPAALLVVVAVDAIITMDALSRPRRWWSCAALLLAVTSLPWLSVKYVPLAVVLALGAAWQLWRTRQRPLIVTGGVVLLMAATVYLMFHHIHYGGWTVYAAGDHFIDTGEFSVVGTSPDVVGRSRRLIGLLVDRSFGIATWSPAWLAAPAAIAVVITDRVRHRGILLAPVLTGWSVATFVALTMHGWWVPGRQIVAVLPLLAVALAVAAQRLRFVGVFVGAGVVAGLINWLWLAIEASTGRRTLIVDFAQTRSWPYRLLSWMMPDGLSGGLTADLWLAAWGVALLASAVWAARLVRRRSSAGAQPCEPVAQPPLTGSDRQAVV